MYYNPFLTPVSAVWCAFQISLGIFRRSKPDKSRRMDQSSLKILWGTIAVSITAGIVLGIKGIGVLRSYGMVMSWIGLALILLGMFLNLWSVLTLKRLFTVDVAIVPRHHIVKTGLYRRIRHPAYTGNLVSFLGLGLALGSWVSFMVVLTPILAAFLYRIRVEERALIQVFGSAYTDYMKSTCRLIPWVY